jgi:chromosome segregation ATPase
MNSSEEQTIESLLAEYDALTGQLGELLKREQANLKSGGSLEVTIEEKQEMLVQITAMNQALRAYSQQRERLPGAVKAKIEHLQNKLMLVLKLDRAVEKAYLSASSPVTGDLKLNPVPSRVSRAYAG